jgi:CBS domain containing-hemolysin-like protein
MISLQFELISGLLLILSLDLITTATRAGFFNSNLARLLGQRELMPPQVNRALNLLDSLPRLQASIRFTQTILRFLVAGVVIMLYAQDRILTSPGILSVLEVMLLTALALFVLEWVVEVIVSRAPESWAIRLAPYAKALMLITMPILTVPLAFSRDTNGYHEGAGTVTEDELMTLVDAGQQEGVLEQGESKMIFSIFRLGDTLAREIMIPRIDLLALDVDTPPPDAVDALLESGFSRVPVYEGTIDNVLGLLYAKDLLRIWREGNQIDSLSQLLRPAYFVPEAKKVDELLAEMQSQRIHMAIVVDEYGGVAGLVTLEDIVEEIVGEILDEYDQVEEMLYQPVSDGEYVFQGRVDLDDFNEIMNTDLPDNEADTLGGFIYSRIGRVPTGGEHIQVDNIQLTVDQVTGRRIRKVRARRIEPADKDGEHKAHVE